MSLTTPIALPLGGCPFHQDVLVTIPVPIDAAGSGSISYPLLPEHKGLLLYAQAVLANVTLTTLAASTCHQVLIGGYDSHTRISHLTSSTNPSGTIRLGVGIVTELGF